MVKLSKYISARMPKWYKLEKDFIHEKEEQIDSFLEERLNLLNNTSNNNNNDSSKIDLANILFEFANLLCLHFNLGTLIVTIRKYKRTEYMRAKIENTDLSYVYIDERLDASRGLLFYDKDEVCRLYGIIDWLKNAYSRLGLLNSNRRVTSSSCRGGNKFSIEHFTFRISKLHDQYVLKHGIPKSQFAIDNENVLIKCKVCNEQISFFKFAYHRANCALTNTNTKALETRQLDNTAVESCITSENITNARCPICLDIYSSEKNILSVLECTHSMHQQCFNKLFDSHSSDVNTSDIEEGGGGGGGGGDLRCPVCRNKIDRHYLARI